MEGLEISEIKLSNLDRIKNRIDAEYYQKHFLKLDEKIKLIGQTNLPEINAKLDCSAFYPSITEYYNFENQGVPFLRVNEIKEGLVKLTKGTAYLPEKILEDNPSTIAIGYPGDMIIAKGGNTLAKVGLITSQYEKYALSRDIILVRTGKLNGYNRFFLWQFLHCKYGQALLWRTSSQTGQPHLTLPSINEINLPKFGLDFEQITETLYNNSVALDQESKKAYELANSILLENLNVKDFYPNQQNVNIKNFLSSFGDSGRLDSEYYQLKYENYQKLVTSYEGGYQPFSGACTLSDKNFIPEEKTEYKYIELSNIGRSGEITDCMIAIGEELPTRARRIVHTNDIVVSSIEGSLDSCALVTPEYDNALCSTGFYVVSSKKINSETLLVLFKSVPMQALLKKGCSGTILTAINKPELDKIPIPIIDKRIQEKIKEKILESFELRRQAEHLLKAAKTAVEIAIEQNEKAAINYITKSIL